MKRHRPLQSGDRFFFASQRLFLNSGFHWLSPLTQTADVTQEKGNGLFFFCFFARQLGFPDFCPVTNCLVWKGGRSQPYTSAGQHRWTEHLPLSSQSQHTEGQCAFSLFPALHARIWFLSTSSRLFAVTQKAFTWQ